MSKVIGIDLGLTNSRVAVQENGKAMIIASTDSHSIKINCLNAGEQFTSEEISAKILRQLADAASAYLGEDITQAVITVPAYFTDAQRQATKNAGYLAGLDVLRTIHEPKAACLAHGLDQRSNEIILVVDLGGTTLDVCVLEVGDGVFDILANSRDFHLGGDNFDKKIVDWLADKFQHQENIDLRQDQQALQRLTEAAQKAKIALSRFTQTEINLPFITATQDSLKHLNQILTRTEFEAMCSDILERCGHTIEQVIQQAKFSLAEINEVVLVGGSTHIPAVQKLVHQLTGIEPISGVNPEEATALGAAIQASVLSNPVESCCISWCFTGLSLGVATQHGLMTRLINRNTRYPILKSQVFSTEMDGQTSVEINILRGERIFAKDNKSLGILRIDGILPAPKGVPQIEVTFNIDANDILSVRVRDSAMGKEASIVIPSALIIPAQELEQMMKDAETNHEEDSKRLEPIKAMEQVKLVVCDAERQLTQLVKNVSDDQKNGIAELVKNLQEVIEQQGGCDRLISLPNHPQPILMSLASPVFALVGKPTSYGAALCAGE